MDAGWVAAGAAGFFLFLFVVVPRLGRVAPPVARQLVRDGARLLDVRTPEEFAGGAVEGAVNVPLRDLPARFAELAPKDKPIVVYCASGTRSAVATSMLRRQGFTQVHNLGPMDRWGIGRGA